MARPVFHKGRGWQAGADAARAGGLCTPAQGHGDAGDRKRLAIKTSAVNGYRKAIYHILGVNSAVELVLRNAATNGKDGLSDE